MGLGFWNEMFPLPQKEIVVRNKDNEIVWLAAIGMLVSVLLIFFYSIIAYSAEQSQCQPWKIQTYFDAAAIGDGTTMWSTLSPRQQGYSSVEELQAKLDLAALRFDSVHLEVLDIEKLPGEGCEYHVVVYVVTLYPETRVMEIIGFHITMDKEGILRVFVERRSVPIMEERVRT